MFKKLFGGGDKKEQAPPTPPPPPPVSKDVEAERVIMSLEQQIRTLTDESNKLDNKVDVLTEKAKQYIAANKKKEAKQTVAELNEIKKKIEVTVALMQLINTRKKVLRTQKNQLEIAKMDLSLADEMGKATEIMKSMDSVNEKMTDIMLDAKEIQQNMEETNRLMKELAGQDQEDEQAEDLFKELEGQVEQDKAQKIQATLNKNPAQVVKPVQSTITATTKVSNVSVEDDLNKWLN